MQFPPLSAAADGQPLRLHFVRDGSGSRALGRCIGQTDVSLSVAGQRECRLLARHLPLTHAVCISSDLQRARATASMLSAGPVIAEPRLREMHFGEWDGQMWADIPPTEDGYEPPWPDDWTTIRAPGGESFDDVVHRVTEWLNALPRDGGDYLVIGHAGSIRAAAAVLLGIPVSRAFTLAVDHATVSTFELTSNGASLIRWNAPGF